MAADVRNAMCNVARRIHFPSLDLRPQKLAAATVSMHYYADVRYAINLIGYLVND